jgi:hypothetical protein
MNRLISDEKRLALLVRLGAALLFFLCAAQPAVSQQDRRFEREF